MSKVVHHLLLLLFCIPIVTITTHAQELSTTVAPQQYEIVAKPGSTVSLPYTVTNIGDPTIYTVHVYNISSDPTTSDYSFTEIDASSDLQIRTSSSSFQIGTPLLLTSDEAVEFDIVISVPESRFKDEYLLAVIAESDPPDGFEDSNRILLQGGTGSRVVLAVTENGEREQRGEMRLFSALTDYSISFAGRNFLLQDSNRPVPLVLRIGNIGKHSFLASGKILVKPQWGEGSSVELPSQRVFAKSERLLSAEDTITETTTLPGRFINIMQLQAYISAGSQSLEPVMIDIVVFPFTISLVSGGICMMLVLTYLLMRYVKKSRSV